MQYLKVAKALPDILYIKNGGGQWIENIVK